MKAKRTVAVCDILGFSDLVARHTLDHVVDDALGWFRKALHHSIHKNDFPEATPTMEELQASERVGLAWFSDTVLLYTKYDSDDAMSELIATVAWLLFETILTGTRIRAGLAYGEVFIDPTNALFVGKPIIEAYHLEQAQEWSGGALATSAQNRVPEWARGGDYADWFIKPYRVPLKDRQTFLTSAVDWTAGIHPAGFELRWSKDSPSPSEREWAERPDVCRKWQNTKRFHDSVCGCSQRVARDGG